MYDDEKWISEQFGQADLGDPKLYIQSSLP